MLIADFSVCFVFFSEDVLNGELMIGDYSWNPPDGRVAVTVTDPVGNIVHSKAADRDGKFAYTATRGGEYRVCFLNVGNKK